MKIIKVLRMFVTRLNPVLSNKIMFKIKMKENLNLKSPATFNEKVNWLKIYDYPFNEKIVNCTDKYNVREYVKNKGYEDILVPLYNSWSNVEDIDFSKLPDKFVLKCNHGAGYNILCKNKAELDIKLSKKILKKWMNEDFGLISGEKHYSKIKRKILCEKYLSDDILDYKFFCFNGEAKFFYISKVPDGDFHKMQSDFFNLDGSIADFMRTDHEHLDKIPDMPQNLPVMIKIANQLASDFKFVRVDLYDVNNKIYFSELTFSPCSGFMPLKPHSKDLEFGILIDIKIKNK